LSITSRHAPLIDQAILADFLVEGHFARHVRRMREIYAERLGVLMESARAHLAGLLTISGLEAGLQTAAWVADGIDAQAAARAAAERDVEVTPLAWYTRGRRPRVIRQGLHLGFAAVDVPEIRRGVRDLALALESLS
jgi:GntR family transcriptional regulator/MocR family aminotransferase